MAGSGRDPIAKRPWAASLRVAFSTNHSSANDAGHHRPLRPKAAVPYAARRLLVLVVSEERIRSNRRRLANF